MFQQIKAAEKISLLLFCLCITINGTKSECNKVKNTIKIQNEKQKCKIILALSCFLDTLCGIIGVRKIKSNVKKLPKIHKRRVLK